MGMLLQYHRQATEAEPQPAEPDAYDDLTDEQVAEVYAINVGGQATSRRGQVKALRKLDESGDE